MNEELIAKNIKAMLKNIPGHEHGIAIEMMIKIALSKRLKKLKRIAKI